jgi:hypothetical protein
MRTAAKALFSLHAGVIDRRECRIEKGARMPQMTTRRVMVWWFRFVLSGRFLDRFLSLPRVPR